MKLTAFHVEYDALTIPPEATSKFTANCSVATDVATAQAAPFAPKVYYLLPHTHTLASGFFASISQRTIPNAKMSARRSTSPPVACSGAM